jgi:hypothetical protein
MTKKVGLFKPDLFVYFSSCSRNFVAWMAAAAPIPVEVTTWR